MTQEALRRALHQARVDTWVARAREREHRTDAIIDTTSLLQDVRDEFGA